MAGRRAPGAGRKRLPTAIHQLRGTTQPSRANPNEPKPELGIPDPPASLDATQRRHWRRIAGDLQAMKVLTRGDGSALMSLVIAHVRVERANRALNRLGACDKDGKRSGWATELTQAQMLLARLCASFGLEPSARSRVNADVGAAAAAPA